MCFSYKGSVNSHEMPVFVSNKPTWNECNVGISTRNARDLRLICKFNRPNIDTDITFHSVKMSLVEGKSCNMCNLYIIFTFPYISDIVTFYLQYII